MTTTTAPHVPTHREEGHLIRPACICGWEAVSPVDSADACVDKYAAHLRVVALLAPSAQ